MNWIKANLVIFLGILFGVPLLVLYGLQKVKALPKNVAAGQTALAALPNPLAKAFPSLFAKLNTEITVQFNSYAIVERRYQAWINGDQIQGVA